MRDFTLPSSVFISPTGIPVRLKPLNRAIQSQFELLLLAKAPKPPVQHMELPNGTTVATENASHPDYLEAKAQYEALCYKEREAFFIRNGVEPLNDEEKVLIEKTKELIRENGLEVPAIDDRVFFLDYVCDISTLNSKIALVREIMAITWPTEEEVKAKAESFRGNV